MNQRTCNIIMCCKGNSRLPEPYGTKLSRLSEVAVYISKECDVPIQEYTPTILDKIMLEALYDYIDTADYPSSDLRLIFEPCNEEDSISIRIRNMFTLCRVRSDNTLVNGFTEELLNQSKIDLSMES